MIDIDHFKSINDTYGLDAGDQVLCCFARILLAEFRTFDSVGRIGGEEFGLLFPHTDLESAVQACDRIAAAVNATILTTDAGEISMTISTGLTQLRPTDDSTRDILKRADRLFCQAKSKGRNRTQSDPLISMPRSTGSVARIGAERIGIVPPQ